LTATAAEGTPRVHGTYREAQQNQRVYAMAVYGGFSVSERKRHEGKKNLSHCRRTSLRT
jgi:hypothetical protein